MIETTHERSECSPIEPGNFGLIRGTEEELIAKPNPARAIEIHNTINRHTLGSLLKQLNGTTEALNSLEAVLFKALRERNRLFHSFYRQHNFRRNSHDGRVAMLADLESIHNDVLDAYKAVMLLSGVDLDALASTDQPILPTRHVPI